MIVTRPSLIRLKFVYPIQSQAIYIDQRKFKKSLPVLEDGASGVASR